MFIQAPLLIIKNNVQSLCSPHYMKEMLSTTWLFIMTFTIPVIILEYCAQLSNYPIFNDICWYCVCIFVIMVRNGI